MGREESFRKGEGMIKDQLDLFADRQEAIYLFEQLCERQKGKPWPIFPVLSLVGPAGSIGYGPLFLARNAQRISILSIDGQDPHNSALIQRDVYQFWNIEHMYTRGQGSVLAQAFIAYMYSDVSNQLLARYQFLHLSDIPQTIRDKHILESDTIS